MFLFVETIYYFTVFSENILQVIIVFLAAINGANSVFSSLTYHSFFTDTFSAALVEGPLTIFKAISVVGLLV